MRTRLLLAVPVLASLTGCPSERRPPGHQAVPAPMADARTRTDAGAAGAPVGGPSPSSVNELDAGDAGR